MLEPVASGGISVGLELETLVETTVSSLLPFGGRPKGQGRGGSLGNTGGTCTVSILICSEVHTYRTVSTVPTGTVT